MFTNEQKVILTLTKKYFEKIKLKIELFSVFSDVHLIVLIGITFFLIFLKYYGQSAVAFCLLITSFAIQWSIISNGILRGIVSGSWPVQLNMEKCVSIQFLTIFLLIKLFLQFF